ncbi:MAG TPA: LysR family transcriptional regulator, partial [Pseudonocardia sp.]
MIDRRLQVLRIVDQLGTITAAAASLHLTPSAVSQQLRQLSHEMGIALLEPDGRRIRLTPAAHALLRHADDLAARWEQARGELNAYAGEAGGMLRLSGFGSLFRTLLIPASQRLRAVDPLLEVRILEVETADSFQRLLTGDVDIAVTLPMLDGPTADDPRFEQQPLQDVPHDLLVPRDHPLAGETDVPLERLAHECWILPEQGSCDQYDLVSVVCSTAGFTPRVAHNARDWAATFALVEAGYGVCIKPRTVPVEQGLAVVQVPLRAPVPRRRLLTTTRRGSRGQRPIALGLDALAAAASASCQWTAPDGGTTPTQATTTPPRATTPRATPPRATTPRATPPR